MTDRCWPQQSPLGTRGPDAGGRRPAARPPGAHTARGPDTGSLVSDCVPAASVSHRVCCEVTSFRAREQLRLPPDPCEVRNYYGFLQKVLGREKSPPAKMNYPTFCSRGKHLLNEAIQKPFIMSSVGRGRGRGSRRPVRSGGPAGGNARAVNAQTRDFWDTGLPGHEQERFAPRGKGASQGAPRPLSSHSPLPPVPSPPAPCVSGPGPQRAGLST